MITIVIEDKVMILKKSHSDNSKFNANFDTLNIFNTIIMFT